MNPRKDMSRLSIKHRIFLVLLGIIIIPLLLEFCLRTVAFIYYKARIAASEKKLNDAENCIKILSLGDSFCFGSGAPFGYDFPAQLEKLLNQDYKDKFIVYNKGIPGQSSSQVLRHLKDNIKKYIPNLIILIIGMDDFGNLEDSNYFLFKKTENLKDIFLKLDIYFSQMRSYKLFKQVVLRLKNRMRLIISKIEEEVTLLAAESNSSIDSLIQSAQKYQQEYDFESALNEIEKALKMDPNSTEVKDKLLNIYLAQRKYDLAVQELRERLKKDPLNIENLCRLAEVYCQKEDYTLALSSIKEVLKISPCSPNAHHILGKIYFKQGKNKPEIKEKHFKLALEEYKKSIMYLGKDTSCKGEVYSDLAFLYGERGDGDLALEAIKRAIDFQPQNKHFWFLLQDMRGSILSPEEKELFDRLLFYNLSKICEIAQSSKIRLILVGYPSDSHQDEIRREIAQKYRVPFIDFAAIFKKMLSEENYNYKDLFSDDGSHCNANGYKIMAEAIHKAVISEMKLGGWVNDNKTLGKGSEVKIFNYTGTVYFSLAK